MDEKIFKELQLELKLLGTDISLEHLKRRYRQNEDTRLYEFNITGLFRLDKIEALPVTNLLKFPRLYTEDFIAS